MHKSFASFPLEVQENNNYLSTHYIDREVRTFFFKSYAMRFAPEILFSSAPFPEKAPIPFPK